MQRCENKHQTLLEIYWLNQLVGAVSPLGHRTRKEKTGHKSGAIILYIRDNNPTHSVTGILLEKSVSKIQNTMYTRRDGGWILLRYEAVRRLNKKY